MLVKMHGRIANERFSRFFKRHFSEIRVDDYGVRLYKHILGEEDINEGRRQNYWLAIGYLYYEDGGKEIFENKQHVHLNYERILFMRWMIQNKELVELLYL
jgi:hypothetical protein